MTLGGIARWVGQNTAAVALITIFAFGCLALPNFSDPMNLSAIAFQYSIIGFLGLGQLLVILTEGIDLSQGSLVAVTSIVTATLMTNAGLPAPIAVVGGVLAAAVLGWLSGMLVSRTPIPAFIVTLGMLGVARGLALLISNAKPISISDAAFGDLGRSKLWEIPVPLLLWLLAAALLHYFLTQRRTGRHIYAVGGSVENARLSGIDVRRVKLFVYVMSGLLTGIGGILWTSRLSSGSPLGGNNYELESIAAVVVGGGSLFGGIGTVGGTVAGVLIFGVINSMLNLAGISPYWQGTLKGILVLATVALSQLRRSGRSSVKGAERHAGGTDVGKVEPARHV
jgi:ribose/xylose/arabinose/galactoside ABC-type transport system permease subunit